MTLPDAIRYKTAFIARLEKQGGTVNRERIRYLGDELETMRQVQAENERLKNELDQVTRRFLDLNGLYHSLRDSERFFSELSIKILSKSIQ